MANKLQSRAGRQTQILMTLELRHKNGHGAGDTCAGLARALGLEPSSYFRQLLSGLVADNRLIMREVELPGRWPGYWYELPDSHVDLLNGKKRSVPVKVNGKPAGQLSLW